MKLRCKPGDLCVIVKTGSPGNDYIIGKIIRVTSTIPSLSGRKTLWLYEPPMIDSIFAIADDYLMPLRDQDGEDECLHAGIKKETHEQQRAAGIKALQHFGVRT